MEKKKFVISEVPLERGSTVVHRKISHSQSRDVTWGMGNGNGSPEQTVVSEPVGGRQVK